MSGASAESGTGRTSTRVVGATVVRRVGCVSYLNARPLIEGLDGCPGVSVGLDVPSRLLAGLEGRAAGGDAEGRPRVHVVGAGDGACELDIALCPVIDYHRSAVPLEVIPVGGVACRGACLTVKLFSRVPIGGLEEVYVDTDSHTSVVLLRVLMQEVYGRAVRVLPYDAGALEADIAGGRLPGALLLIGDKVVRHAERLSGYAHQLDLGEAWYELTGLPFVFAVWMARAGADLGGLPGVLAARLAANEGRLDEIASRYAERHGFTVELAERYLREMLHYRIGADELAGMERFGELAARYGLIDRVRKLQIRRDIMVGKT